MVVKKVGFSRTKIWLVFGALFVCGAFVGVGIANWNHAVKVKRQINSDVIEQHIDEELTSCQALENVLLHRLFNQNDDCALVKRDVDTLKKLATYGCDENHDKYTHEIDNKNAILDVACDDFDFDAGTAEPSTEPCEQIEANLQQRLGKNYIDMGAGDRVYRAKIYAIMAEQGCPEHSAKYVEAAKRELEIARGISDDKLTQDDTIEVVETYKRLKMQKDAEEVFNKVKKLTNPAIDFIIQVEKIVNE